MTSLALDVGLFAAMTAGALAPIHPSPRRSSFHLLNSTAFAAFAILGLACLRLVLAAAVAAGLLLLLVAAAGIGGRVRGWLLPAHLSPFAGLGRLGLNSGFLVVAVVVAWAVQRGLGQSTFPLPLGRPVDILVFVCCSTAFSATMAALSEAYHLLFSPPVPQASALPRELAFLPSDAPLYRLMLVSGSSLQILAQFLYLSYGEAALLVGVGWFALSIWVHAALLSERLRLHRAFRELEASHRALATGEPTARIVHQARHQLGLIGISTHLMREGLRSARPDRVKILEQLGRLEGVVATLRRLLSEAQEPPRGGEDAEAERPRDEAETERPPGPVRGLSLRDLVHEEVERLRGKAEQLGIHLALRPGPAGVVPRLSSDTEPLGQGIFNVIENALAAARRSVCVLVEEAGAEIRVVVEDDGPGMPPDVLRRAGEPFVTTKEEGTGMGLFVAVAAARRWGGSLTVENRREGGLRASFRLPRTGSTGGPPVG